LEDWHGGTKSDLYGYSSSGFFTLYALANEPGLFRSYLAGSGDTDIAAPYFLAHDQKLVARDGSKPVDVYLSVGDQEGLVPSSQALVDGMRAKAYPGVRLVNEIYPGEVHGAGGSGLTFSHGLRMCFPT
jgi:uncharacterized protein